MIVKVCARVTNVRGMVGYLMGPGKERIHQDQHTVAGSIHYAEPNSTELRKQLSADLELHSKLHPDVQIKGGNVYHVVLSLPAEDGQIPDRKWNQVATEFMTEMGMTGTGPKATMWTAIRHGLSAEGNDHVHIVTNLIRQDGTRVSLHNDMVRASKVAAELERKYGLRQLAGRGVGGNQAPYTGKEAAMAAKTKTEIEKVTLERFVRAAAEASTGEGEFVRRLRAQGIEVRAYRQANEVTGYSVKLVGGKFAYGGGKLAPDLSLPALRRRWEQSAAHQRSAAHEWVKGRQGQPVGKYGAETRANMPPAEKVTAELSALRGQIVEARTVAQIREASRQLSGALAAGAQVDGRLVKPSREIAAWAPRGGSRRRFQMASVTMALLVAAQSNGLAAELVMVKMITDALMELYRLHRMRAQAVHIHRSTQPRGVAMTEPDGMEEVLDGGLQAGVVAVAAGVQQLAQMGQDKLIDEAKAKEAALTGNRGGAWAGSAGTAVEEGQTVAGVQTDQGPPMTTRQEETLEQIAGRAGLDVTELRLGDMTYGNLTVSQAAKMIDALGDPKYGSTGNARHTLDDLRAARAAGTTMTPTAQAGTGTAQQYARTSQVQGPGAGKNQTVRRKF